MPRRTPPDRLRDVARAACQVFTEKGYRRTLLTDVAARLGLSHALLYRYAESKEALFELALRYAMNPGEMPAVEVPLPSPPPGQVLDMVAGWASEPARFPSLDTALARDHAKPTATDHAKPTATDHAKAAASDHAKAAASELAAIIDEFYAFVEDNRRLLALIERSALDLPELHALYFTGFRRAYVGRLARYLQRQAGPGGLRPVPDAGVAARFIVESIAWFAWHRKADPDSDMIADEPARRTVRDLLLAAFVPGEPHHER